MMRRRQTVPNVSLIHGYGSRHALRGVAAYPALSAGILRRSEFGGRARRTVSVARILSTVANLQHWRGVSAWRIGRVPAVVKGVILAR